MIEIFAVTTRGLEDISAAEMTAHGFSVRQTAYRRVEAGCDSLASTAQLRTVDDLFVVLAGWHDISHTRAELPRFEERSAALNLEPALAAVSVLRQIALPARFSITANFVGGRNYSAPEIKAHAASGITRRHPAWRYTEEDNEADLNLRLFIEHDKALVGLRVMKTPLHRRPYKIHHLPGSLKPATAAALLLLSGAQPGMRLLDPFCGVGTILVEAAASGLDALGGDIEYAALEQAAANTRAAGVRANLCQWDAARLPFAPASFDRIISNLPWGRQITVDESLTSLYQRAFAQMTRVLRPGGSIVLLTTLPHLIDYPPTQQREISLFGQNPQIMRFDIPG